MKYIIDIQDMIDAAWKILGESVYKQYTYPYVKDAVIRWLDGEVQNKLRWAAWTGASDDRWLDLMGFDIGMEIKTPEVEEQMLVIEHLQDAYRAAKRFPKTTWNIVHFTHRGGTTVTIEIGADWRIGEWERQNPGFKRRRLR